MMPLDPSVKLPSRSPRALAFDVFGTVADWRTSIARAFVPVLARLGRDDVPPAALADGWRARYQPKLDEVRSGARDFVILDTLHREALVDLLAEHGLAPGDDAIDALTHAWHRLDAWPDSVAGLTRLKARFPIVTLSNGNISLLLDMARHAHLPWDAILGAEVSRVYKPLPRAYLTTAQTLGLTPAELCLVASHHSDLAAARASGLMTAYIDRPMEYGGAPAPDARMAQDWEYRVASITELADRLGC